MSRYMSVSRHAEDLADGRVLAPGERADIDPEAPHNQALIEDGRLIPAPEPAPKRARNRNEDEVS